MKFWGIEVKSGRDVARGDLSGLDSLAERIKSPRRRIVIFLGPRRLNRGATEFWPLLNFLETLPR